MPPAANTASLTADLSAGSPRRVWRSTARCFPTSPFTSPRPSRLWWIRRPPKIDLSIGASRPRHPPTVMLSPFRLDWHMSDIQSLESDIAGAIAGAADEAALEQVRIAALGKKG